VLGVDVRHPVAAGGRGRPWLLATAVAGGTVALFGAVVATAVLSHNGRNSYFLISIGVSIFVGWVVARHVPRNPIGWLLLAACASVGAFALCQQVAGLTYRHHPLVVGVCGVLTQVFYFCFLFAAPLVLLFFPDGRLPSPRWRRVLAAYLVIAAGEIAVIVGWSVHLLLVGPLPFNSSGDLAKTDSPGPAVGLVLTVLVLGCLGLALSWVVRRIAGFRRTTGVVRQQSKWLALGAVFLVISLIVSLITPSGNSTTSTVGNVISNVAAVPFPVTVGIAILRYRLYDIDRVISRTLAFALLTGLLVGFYVGAVTLATRVLPFSSPVAVAASTLAAAALFNPLRRRLQRGVERRFNRARYDAERVVAAFAERLRNTVGLDTVREDLMTVVHRTLEPAAVSLWLPVTADSAGLRPGSPI
jgi:hypothetical protein